MAQFSIQLKEGQAVTVSDADTYQFEGPLTTFFSTGSNLQVIDSWSTRVASYRTADIISIERCDTSAGVDGRTIDQLEAGLEAQHDGHPTPAAAAPPIEIDLRGLVAA